jgi:type I protein arginine methyltransferase
LKVTSLQEISKCCLKFRFLVKGGKLYPGAATIHFTPFCDESLYKEQINKVSFFDNQNFLGLDMTSLKEEALREKFRQPIIDIYNPSIQ